jgi:hypothetical protein
MHRSSGFVALLAALVTLIGAGAANAATFTVNTSLDRGDGIRGDGVCDFNVRRAGPQCTLRAAIQEANLTAVGDAVDFKIGGPDPVKTITPRVGLPAISRPLTIDGYSQPGASLNTASVGTNAVLKIVLDGSIVGNSADGLTVTAPDSVIRGLVINNGFNSGILLDKTVPEGAVRRVSGNFIGTDPSGTVASPTGSAITIGGGPNNVIGGTVPAARNLLSGNLNWGVGLSGSAHDNSIQGNLIGTQRDGTSALHNHFGIYVLTGTDNRIGGSGGAANTIAFNTTQGVLVQASTELRPDGGTGNRILGNSIFANGSQGIELDGDGPTPNDLLDPDSGANELQNYPVITSAERTTDTRVTWSLNSEPESVYTIQFFINPDTDRGEGRRFIGEQIVRTDASGYASAVFVHGERLLFSQWVTATATDREGNTSEFSAPREVLPGGDIEF